jgi:predicted dehydrogenase
MIQDNKLKVGVIGVGRMGAFHVDKYASLPNVELVGVADIRADRAREVAARFNTEAFFDFRDLITRIQAATIAVPTSLHFEVARQCLEAGVNILVEKPLATSVEQIVELEEMVGQRGLVLMPGHVERFNVALAAVKKVIDSPRFIEVHRLNVFSPRGTDVDVILDLMIHDLDIILDLVPFKVKEIFSIGVPVLSQNIDIANVRLHFDPVCVANITASRVSQEVLRKLRIFQANTYISIDYAEEKVEMVHRRIEGGEPILSGETLKLENQDALLSEVGAFVHSVISGDPPPVTAKNARYVMKISNLIQENMLTSDPGNSGGL